MAEDFREAFGLGASDTSIGVQDLASVTLAAVQALEQRTAEIVLLRAQLAALEERLAAIEKK